jgi:hypothetical protein
MQPRAFRHAELTATAGALFPLHPKLRVRGGPGLRTQLLAGGDAGRVRPLFEAGAALDPIALATFGPLSARLEGLVDYVFLDPASAREHQVRASAKLSLPLLPLLFVTAGVDAYAVQQRRLGWGVAYDTTVGLRFRVDAARQAL